jgi:hypothetical protein
MNMAERKAISKAERCGEKRGGLNEVGREAPKIL